MSKEIEIEFKNLLTEAEFIKLCHAFSIRDEHFSEQVNHYFDTPSLEISGNHAALRIRQKHEGYTLTLKQKHPEGMLETHQVLTDADVKQVFLGGFLPEGVVKNELVKTNVTIADLNYLGKLKTNRAEIAYNGDLLVFDESFYLGKHDFELEFEVMDRKQGEIAFIKLLNKYDIPIRKSEHKIERFFSTLA